MTKSTKRKAISKKIRFEVFKRDSFKCQYCGVSAPDAILNVDHIDPVFNGGSNELINLITSCFDCNSGKSKNLISDDSLLNKQKAQLDEVSERRAQMHLMLKWRKELGSIEHEKHQAIISAVHDELGFPLNDYGKSTALKWTKTFSLEEILDAIDICSHQYLVYENGEPTLESFLKAFDYIPRVAKSKRTQRENPSLSKIYYARGILRNRVSYVNETVAINDMKSALQCGVDVDDIIHVSKNAKSWSQFRAWIQELINESA